LPSAFPRLLPLFRSLLLLGLVALGVAPVSSAASEERILSYHVRLFVELDGVLEVEETIRVRSAGRQIQRGIYRDLPTLYRGRWGLRDQSEFEIVSVSRDGEDEPYQIESHRAGIRIRIGSADRHLPHGEHTYVLRYRSGGQLLFFDSHDELYWNVTGDEWAFPIDEAAAELILPPSTPVATAESYLGPKGSGETGTATFSGPRAEVAAGRALEPGEGLTIVATWAPRSLDPAAYEFDAAAMVGENWLLLGGLVLVVAMLLWHTLAWLAVGKDPAPGRIIPLFEPPPGFSPAAARMLRRMGFDNTCFSAAVMALGVKGVLEIEGDGKSLVLRATGAAPTEPLTPDEKALLKKLFAGKTRLELKQTNHQTVSAARKALQKSLAAQLEKTHFLTNARYWVPGFLFSLAAMGLLLLNSRDLAQAGFMGFWLGFWSLGTGALLSAVVSQVRGGNWISAVPMGCFSVPFVIGWFVGLWFFVDAAGPITAGAFVFTITLNVLFYHWIKAPTHLGREVLDRIEGFLHYLSVAEEDRLSGFRGPERTPELFERFLPYAHALGVEQAWSEKFREVLARAASSEGGSASTYRPRFHSSAGTGRVLSAAALGSALSSALTTASTSPSSSGSGGRGSSGGGRGGGGGGGW